MSQYRPFILGIGGALRLGSSNEAALRIALNEASEMGAEVDIVTGPDLELPVYAPGPVNDTGAPRAFVEKMRRADGFLIATPSYHGGMSGLVKNAIDYTEEMREDDRPYFDGRAVGCIVCAGGAQGASSAISGMRSMVHALRGWPTPFAAAIDASCRPFDPDGTCNDVKVEEQLRLVGRQVTEFAQMAMVAASQKKPVAAE